MTGWRDVKPWQANIHKVHIVIAETDDIVRFQKKNLGRFISFMEMNVFYLISRANTRYFL